jgi:hypothetical protein
VGGDGQNAGIVLAAATVAMGLIGRSPPIGAATRRPTPRSVSTNRTFSDRDRKPKRRHRTTLAPA